MFNANGTYEYAFSEPGEQVWARIHVKEGAARPLTAVLHGRRRELTNASLADMQTWLDDNGVNVQIADEGQTALGTLGRNLSEGSGELVAFTQDALRTLVEASLALILIIVISVYMLLYGERIGAGVRAIVPRETS